MHRKVTSVIAMASNEVIPAFPLTDSIALTTSANGNSLRQERAWNTGPERSCLALNQRHSSEVKPLQRPVGIAFRRLDQQVVMVVHQHVGMQQHTVSFNHPVQQFDEMLPVAFSFEISLRHMPRVVIWYNPPAK